MYDKKFASKEERLANLHIIVNHLASEVTYRPEIKNTLVHYINLRDQISMELEHMYCECFNKKINPEMSAIKLKEMLSSLKN